MIVPTSKCYFVCPLLDSYLWLISSFWTLMHQTFLTYCHLIFKSQNVIILFLILALLDNLIIAWLPLDHA